jgi:hypothetical protein
MFNFMFNVQFLCKSIVWLIVSPRSQKIKFINFACRLFEGISLELSGNVEGFWFILISLP